MSLVEIDMLGDVEKAELVALHLVQGQIDSVAQFLAKTKNSPQSAEIPGDHD